MREFLLFFLGWYIIIPAAALCFAPMKNQLKYKGKSFVFRIVVPLFLILILMTVLDFAFNPGYNGLLLPMAVITLFLYLKCVNTHPSKGIAIYAVVFSAMSFMSNFSIGFDALLHPYSNPDALSFEALLFQAFLFTAFSAILFIPFYKYGSRLVDHFDINRVWYITLPVSLIFLMYNLLMTPKKYETFHINRVGMFFWASQPLLLILFLLMMVIFYFIVIGMVETSEIKKRSQILEMQESQFISQQKYLEESARTRHDFRQIIRTLKMLYDEKDFETLGNYINKYMENIPEKKALHYCKNNALNALLNYYMGMASQSSVEVSLQVELPEKLEISDVDLCSVVGNIFENAIRACSNIEPGKGRRWIQLSVTFKGGRILYIVATNTYGGKLKQKSGRYLSTSKRGEGLGLLSIAETAKTYGGTAEFYNDEERFYTNVMLVADHES